jgi:hypothetical protein
MRQNLPVRVQRFKPVAFLDEKMRVAEFDGTVV